MRRLFIIVVAVMLVIGGCKASKNTNDRSREERERLDSDQRQFRRTFEQEMNR